MNNTQKMTAIMRRLKTEMNGAVAGAMEDRGIRYGLNYGVSAITIKNLVKEYAPDHDLALFLFKQDVRELKIAAIYIDDPQQVTKEQMNEWAEEFTTEEMMEHCTMGLFYAAACAQEVALEWIKTDRVKAALRITGKRAAMGLLDDAEIFLRAIERGVNNSEIKCVNTAVYALCKIASVSDELRCKVVESLGKMNNKEIAQGAKSLI